MQSHRLISGATILLMIVLVVAGWFLVAQPQLAAAATANSALTGVQTEIARTQTTIAQLRSQQKDLPKLEKQLAALRTSIPATAAAASYIDGLNALAASAGVTLTSIAVSDGVAYTPPVVVPPPAAAGSPAAGSTPTPAASAKPATPVAPTGWIPKSDPRITGSNFIAIPVSISTVGDWNATLSFFKKLQSGKRLFLVAGFSTDTAAAAPVDTTQKTTTKATPVVTVPQVTSKITGFIYVLLDPKADALIAAQKKTATPTPTPTPTPTVSTSPNPSGSSTPTPTTSPTP